MPNIKLSKVHKPFTPMRRFILDVLRPSVAIGKRLRDIEEDHENTPPAPDSPCISQNSHNCVALQNEDMEEDAVVITALNVVPFCCHADLLLMNRHQLVEVADNLNAKLPSAMRIDTTASRTDSFIRSSIELIVGIRHVVPQAPKANRSLSLSVSNLDFNSESLVPSILPLSPLSPLATRKRHADAVPDHSAGPPLASLQEEIEDVVKVANRPQKRRRIHEDSSPDASPTPIRRQILRSQSHRATASSQPKASPAARGGRVLRSRSERLPPLRLKGAHRNVTTARGRTTTRVQSTMPVMTSTPKERVGCSPSVEPVDSLSFATMPSTATSSSSSGSLSSTPRLERVGVWLTRKDATENDAREVTSGMQNMAVHASPSDSDMDISL